MSDRTHDAGQARKHATGARSARQPAGGGLDGSSAPSAATGRLAPGTPEWGDWVQQIINDTSASAEDLARYFDTPPSARQHVHDWHETTRWCDTGRIHECRCGETYEEPRL